MSKDKEGSFISHLTELRKRLINSLIFLAVLFVVCYYFSEYIYGFLVEPYANAVKDDDTVQLRWPVESKNPEISEDVNATELWHDLIESAHGSAEPGILFWDTALRMTPSDIYAKEGFRSTSTNPCGEIILSPHDSCRLMLINLSSFVSDPWTKKSEFDFLRINIKMSIKNILSLKIFSFNFLTKYEKKILIL